jgi:hypothetical protein
MPSLARADAICDGRYHWVDVPGTRCIDGTPTGFQYICRSRAGADGPLLIYLPGAGACADGDSCDCQPDANGQCQGPNATNVWGHFQRPQSYDGQLWGQEIVNSGQGQPFGQIPVFSGSSSPFVRQSDRRGEDWNFLFIPTCTGDGNTGDRDRNYTTSDGRAIHAWHYGFINIGLDLPRVSELFPAPQKVALWGQSAGGVGVDCNMARVHDAFPDAPMFAMNSVGFTYSAYGPSGQPPPHEPIM